MSEIRAPRGDDEIAAWFAAEAIGFGATTPDPEFVAAERTVLPPGHMVGVWEGTGAVAVGGFYPFELTLPGATTVPVTGVADIAVVPGHRGQGHLTRLMAHLHEQGVERGDRAAVLTASAGSIYRRFGYGIATTHLVWELDTARAAIADPPATDLTVDHVAGVGAAEELTVLWERTRRHRPGTLSRSVEWWRLVLGPLDHWKGGGKVFTLLLRDGAGLLRGAVPYRLRQEVDRGIQQWTVEPLEVVADAPEVEVRLWQEVVGLAHVTRVAPRVRPLDDPLRFLLDDPRQLRVGAMVDLLWVCPLDIPALLAARTYATEGSLLLGVDDPFNDHNQGAFRLETGLDGAGCTPVAGAVDPDLRLSSAALGSVVLGGTTFSTLALAGHVDEVQPGALARADAAFATPLAPFNSTFF